MKTLAERDIAYRYKIHKLCIKWLHMQNSSLYFTYKQEVPASKCDWSGWLSLKAHSETGTQVGEQGGVKISFLGQIQKVKAH